MNGCEMAGLAQLFSKLMEDSHMNHRRNCSFYVFVFTRSSRVLEERRIDGERGRASYSDHHNG